MKSGHARLVIVSAPSGCGKTTVVERLLARNRNYRRSVSYTTRQPRGAEKNGIDYFFVSREEFNALRRRNFFLETATVFGQQYGTPGSPVLLEIRQGRNVVVTIDIQGKRKICRKAAGKIPVLTVFILPPSEEELRKRLSGRGTESAQQIKRRIRMARIEMEAAVEYDFIVVNQNINQTVKEMKEILS